MTWRPIMERPLSQPESASEPDYFSSIRKSDTGTGESAATGDQSRRMTGLEIVENRFQVPRKCISEDCPLTGGGEIAGILTGLAGHQRATALYSIHLVLAKMPRPNICRHELTSPCPSQSLSP